MGADRFIIFVTAAAQAAAGGGAAPTIGQIVATGGGGGNTVTTGNITTAASGSTFLIAAMDQSIGSYNTPTDSKSNVYVSVGSAIIGAECLAVWACVNGTGGASHNATVTDNGGTGLISAILVEILGAKTSGAIDSGSVADTLDDNSSPWTITSGTFAQAVNLCCCFIGGGGVGGNPCVYSESVGLTVHATAVTDGNNNFPLALAYKSTSATTAQSASFTNGCLSECSIKIFGVQS